MKWHADTVMITQDVQIIKQARGYDRPAEITERITSLRPQRFSSATVALRHPAIPGVQVTSVGASRRTAHLSSWRPAFPIARSVRHAL